MFYFRSNCLCYFPEAFVNRKRSKCLKVQFSLKSEETLSGLLWIWSQEHGVQSEDMRTLDERQSVLVHRPHTQLGHQSISQNVFGEMGGNPVKNSNPSSSARIEPWSCEGANFTRFAIMSWLKVQEKLNQNAAAFHSGKCRKQNRVLWSKVRKYPRWSFKVLLFKHVHYPTLLEHGVCVCYNRPIRQTHTHSLSLSTNQLPHPSLIHCWYSVFWVSNSVLKSPGKNE